MRTSRRFGGEAHPSGARLRSGGFDARVINDRVFAYYPPLRRIKEYLDRDPTQAMPLRSAAGIAGLEAKYFSAFFRAKTGVRFSDWLSYRRIESAMDLIRRSDDSITAVAFAVGYQDLTTFERAFKKFNGQTPRDFKRQVRPVPGCVDGQK